MADPAYAAKWMETNRARNSNRESYARAGAKNRGPRYHKRGAGAYQWKGGQSQQRKTFAVKQWRTAVYERDGYACQVCHEVGGRLNAHHVYPWAKHPDRRFDVANGLTLCESCHALVHGSDAIGACVPRPCKSSHGKYSKPNEAAMYWLARLRRQQGESAPSRPFDVSPIVREFPMAELARLRAIQGPPLPSSGVILPPTAPRPFPMDELLRLRRVHGAAA